MEFNPENLVHLGSQEEAPVCGPEGCTPVNDDAD